MTRGKNTTEQRAKERLKAATPCDCGSWPHNLGCAFLVWCVRTRKAGFCSTCGHKLKLIYGWDEDMQCVLTGADCPSGCRHDRSWTRPTKRDIKRLGLVEEAPPADFVAATD